jgi:hypothetical protein
MNTRATQEKRPYLGKDDRRKSLLNAAAELVEEAGWGVLNMSALADRAGVSRQLVYQHFPFLLGARPSLGDFGLVGTMYGHLGRDPWPKRELIEPRIHLNAWLERMKNPAGYATQNLLGNDQIPETLNPVFKSIFEEFIPMVEQVGELATQYAQQNGSNQRLPRRIGEVTTTMGGKPFKRGALPYMTATCLFEPFHSSIDGGNGTQQIGLHQSQFIV